MSFSTIPLESFSCDLHELRCPSCGDLPATAPTRVRTYPWAGYFQCQNPNCLVLPCYYVCSLCERQVHPLGNPIRSRKGLRSHSRNQHHKSRSSEFQQSTQIMLSPNSESTDQLAVISPSVLSASNWLPAQSHHFDQPFDFASHFPSDNSGNLSNCKYFERQHAHRLSGASGIVSSACYKDDVGAIELHPANTLYAYLVALLSKHIPGNYRGAFAAVLHHSSRTQIDPPVPSSPNKLKSQFFSGTRSILQNIPRPRPKTLDNDHIYVSLFDAIRDLFGHGGDVESIFPGSPSVHSNTPRGRELILNAQLAREEAGTTLPQSTPLFILPIYLWRDGFEPNNTKNNRGSVWACLASFGTPQSKVHSSCNTYIIGLGPHDKKHEEVEELLLNDLVKLAGVNYFYSGKINKMVAVYAQIYSIQEDRPEKADHTYTIGGGSTNHSCFGYAANLASIWDKFPSCQSCYLRLVAGDIPILCEGCFDWNLDKARYPSPEHYPTDELYDALDGSIPAKKIVFTSLADACARSHLLLVAKTWSNANAKVYLRSFGVQPAFIQSVVTHAKVCSLYNKALLTDRLPAFQHKYPGFSPQQNCPLPSPSPWDYPQTDMADWVETIMHHLFLGITLAISKEFVNGWLKAHLKFTSFRNRIDPMLEMVQSLSLNWCRAMPIGEHGTFGPHVSENYLAHARLFRWIYSAILLAEPTDKEYIDPVDKTVSEYNLKEGKAWLTARRIEFDKDASLPLILQTIDEVIDRSGGSAPPIFPPVHKAAPLEALMSILISFLPMIARIMIRGVVTELESKDALRHIKIFLTTVNRFETYGKATPTPGSDSSAKPAKPVILSKYNFITLLKIPGCMLRFGSLRLLWEGDGKGEGALPLLKRSVNCLTGNWAFNVAVNYYQNRGISRVLQTIVPAIDELDDASLYSSMIDAARNIISVDSDSKVLVDDDAVPNDIDSSSTDGRQSVRYKSFKTYDSQRFVSNLLQTGVPISVVGLDGCDDIFVVLKDKENKLVLRLRPGSFLGHFSAMAYFDWRVDPSPVSICSIGNVPFPLDSRISRRALLLPLIHWQKHTFVGTIPETAPFGLITDDWEEMFADGSVQKPKFLPVVPTSS